MYRTCTKTDDFPPDQLQRLFGGGPRRTPKPTTPAIQVSTPHQDMYRTCTVHVPKRTIFLQISSRGPFEGGPGGPQNQPSLKSRFQPLHPDMYRTCTVHVPKRTMFLQISSRGPLERVPEGVLKRFKIRGTLKRYSGLLTYLLTYLPTSRSATKMLECTEHNFRARARAF